MEIKTTLDIWKIKYDTLEDGISEKKWVAVDDEIKEALALYLHLKNHTEVQEAPMYKGMPCCKICNKSAYQIMAEEWDALTT